MERGGRKAGEQNESSIGVGGREVEKEEEEKGGRGEDVRGGCESELGEEERLELPVLG